MVQETPLACQWLLQQTLGRLRQQPRDREIGEEEEEEVVQERLQKQQQEPRTGGRGELRRRFENRSRSQLNDHALAFVNNVLKSRSLKFTPRRVARLPRIRPDFTAWTEMYSEHSRPTCVLILKYTKLFLAKALHTLVLITLSDILAYYSSFRATGCRLKTDVPISVTISPLLRVNLLLAVN